MESTSAALNTPPVKEKTVTTVIESDPVSEKTITTVTETTPVIVDSVDKEQTVSEILLEKGALIDQVSEYSFVIFDSIYLLLGGLFIIFIIQSLARKLLYPHLKNKRFVHVVFGTLYLLVLVITFFLAIKKVGIEVGFFAPMIIISILIGSIIFFFLLPFFPRLPFKTGHMIEVNGILGIVDAISTYHTTIRKFNGSMVFIPNALVLASKITNFHDTPFRRIEMKFHIKTDTNIEQSKALILKLINEDEHILTEPETPVIYLTDADADGVYLEAYCWVNNTDWLSVRSDLWQTIMSVIAQDNSIILSRPQQEIFLNK